MAPLAAPRARPAWHRVFALTWLSYAAYYLTRRNFSVSKKTIEVDLGLSRAGLGWIDTGYLATYAVGQFVWGAVADRAGARRVIVAGMVASALCAAAFGASSTFVLLALVFALNGLAQSTGWPANVKAMAEWCPAGRRGRIMGIWATTYSAGSLAANALATESLAAGGWRAAFLVPAVAVVIAALVIRSLWPRETAPVGVAPGEPRAAGTAATGATAATRGPGSAAPSPEDVRRARRAVLCTPFVWALGAAYFFMKLTRYVLFFWLPYYMQDALGYSAKVSGYLPLAFEGGGVAGAIVAGWASDRLTGGRRMPVSVVSLVLLAVALAIYGQVSTLGIAANVVTLAAAGFFLAGPDSIAAGAAAQDVGGPVGAATAAGVVNGLGSLGPILTGYVTVVVSRDLGWPWLFTLLGAGALVSAVILAPSWRRGR